MPIAATILTPTDSAWRCIRLCRLALAALLLGPLAAPKHGGASEPDARSAARSNWQELRAWLAENGSSDRDPRRLKEHEQRVETVLASDSPDWFAVQQLDAVFADAAEQLDVAALRTLRYQWADWLDQLPVPTSADLAGAARSAAEQPGSFSVERLEAARQRFLEDLSQLETQLNRTPDDPRWSEYLELGPLRAAIAGPESLAGQWWSVDHVPERFRIGAVVWPTRVLVAAARSLEELAALARVHADPEFQEARRARLSRLASLLEDQPVRGQTLPPGEVAEICQWLRDRNADETLVAAVSRRFLHPNFVLFVSSAALSANLNQRLDEAFPVDDVIAGTRVRGQGRMTGEIESRFEPSVGEGIVELSLRGRTVASTRGFAGGATISSTGYTDVYGSKRIVLRPEGLQQLPATATANARINYDSVNTNRLLGRQQVVNRVYANRAWAERDSAGKTSAYVRSRLDEMVLAHTAPISEQLRSEIILPLTSRHIWPETQRIRSGPQGLTIALVQRDGAQFGADQPPPPPDRNGGIQLSIHGSLVERLLTRLVRGKTFDGADVYHALQPRDAAPAPSAAGAWSLTFAESEPVSVTFQEMAASVTLRLAGLQADGRQLIPMEISGRYLWQLRDGRLGMVREGDFQIYPLGFVPGEDRLSGPQLVARQILRRKLDEHVPREIDLPALLGREHAAAWTCERFEIRDGWLVLQRASGSG